jgi:hypothetical protein
VDDRLVDTDRRQKETYFFFTSAFQSNVCYTMWYCIADFSTSDKVILQNSTRFEVGPGHRKIDPAQRRC